MNAAQTIHSLLGVPVQEGRKQAHGNKNASATKAGPGRHHISGHQKDGAHKHKGASASFVLHKASAEKQERRNTMAAVGGRRQYIKKMKQALRDQRAAVEAGMRASRQPEALSA